MHSTRFRAFRTLAALSFLSLSLTGCALFGDTPPGAQTASLPAVPADIRTCFKSVTTLPQGDWDKVQVVQVIGTLRKSELQKTDCGRSLLKFYDDVAAGRR